eukprot:gb/GECG01015441.1/.p1 GENE.gb/GECG01015441.1/~~gb/GECG01015441.1/.p1  ORF type:complete len:500 (+),score=47.84 gb/GECG01015441.1/:1-1500(+)
MDTSGSAESPHFDIGILLPDLHFQFVYNLTTWGRNLVVAGTLQGQQTSAMKVLVLNMDRKTVSTSLDLFEFSRKMEKRSILLATSTTSLFIAGTFSGAKKEADEAIESALKYAIMWDGESLTSLHNGRLLVPPSSLSLYGSTVVVTGDLERQGSNCIQCVLRYENSTQGLTVIGAPSSSATSGDDFTRSPHICFGLPKAYTIGCIGAFTEFEGIRSNGVVQYKDGEWKSLVPFYDVWALDLKSEQNQISYSFGKPSSRSRTLQLPPSNYMLQPSNLGGSNSALKANAFTLALESVHDRTTDDRFGVIRSSLPRSTNTGDDDDFIVSGKGRGMCSPSKRMLFLRHEKTTEDALCCFDSGPDAIEDMKSQCKHSVPARRLVVAHDTWPVLMVNVDESGSRRWVVLGNTPSDFSLVYFEGFPQTINREITSNKQSVAALFGQAAGLVGLLTTIGAVLKNTVDRSLLKSETTADQKAQDEPGDSGAVAVAINPISRSENNRGY